MDFEEKNICSPFFNDLPFFSTWGTSAHPGRNSATRGFFRTKTRTRLMDRILGDTLRVFCGSDEYKGVRNGSKRSETVFGSKMADFGNFGTVSSISPKRLICWARTLRIWIEEDKEHILGVRHAFWDPMGGVECRSPARSRISGSRSQVE